MISFSSPVESNHSVEFVDTRSNPIIKRKSVLLLHSINDALPNPRVAFTLPESPFSPPLIPRALSDTPTSIPLQLKPFKDACILLQLLHKTLALQHMSSLPYGVTHSHAPLHIPQELVFNPNLEGHRCFFQCASPLERIVNKMLASPSLIALRIDSIISYLSSVIDVSDDPVLDLLVHNLVLVDAYLNASPLLTTTISVDGVSTPFQLSSTLTTPLGTFQRSGIVKVRLIRLVECILRKASICAIHTIAMVSLHSTFIVCLPIVFHA